MPGPSAANSTVMYAPITWLIVIVGWMVINDQNNKRETRKEIRARIDIVRKWIESAEIKAIEYHTSENNPPLARSIKSDIARISSTVNSIENILENDLPFLIFRFRSAVTLENFDATEHRVIEIDDDLIDGIAADTFALIDALEVGYSDKYHSHWLKRLKSKYT